jgi:hypothetical protein
MAINSPGIGTEDVAQSYQLPIELATTRPSTTEAFVNPKIPGQLVGFYNGLTNSVDLYIVDVSGIRYLKIS